MSFRQVFTDRGSHVYIFQIKLQNGHKNSGSVGIAKKKTIIFRPE